MVDADHWPKTGMCVQCSVLDLPRSVMEQRFQEVFPTKRGAIWCQRSIKGRSADSHDGNYSIIWQALRNQVQRIHNYPCRNSVLTICHKQVFVLFCLFSQPKICNWSQTQHNVKWGESLQMNINLSFTRSLSCNHQVLWCMQLVCVLAYMCLCVCGVWV